MQLKRLNVARVFGVLLCFCMSAGESLEADTVYHLRFEDDSTTDVIDVVSGAVVGTLEEPTTICDDTPGPTSQDETNNFALDSQRGRGAVVYGADLPFIFHNDKGDATLEFYAKVPDGQPHASLFWTENRNPGFSGVINIYWEEQSLPTVAASMGGSATPMAGTPGIGQEWATLGDSPLFPTDEWFHLAIVRTELEGRFLPKFNWDWYLNGELLVGHSGTITERRMPSARNDWLIARRTLTTGFDFRGFMDEIRGSDEALEPEDFLYAGPLSPTGGNCKPDATELTVRDAWYRFEEGEGTDIRNAFDNAIEGSFEGGQYSDDTVGEIVDRLTGSRLANDFSYQNKSVFDLCTVTKTSFVLHKPEGDATFECFVKVRSPDTGQQTIVWSNPGSDTNLFNIFWNAGQFLVGEFNTDVATTTTIGPGLGDPQPVDQWFHMAIVRTDNGDSSFAWDWYFNGVLSPEHGVTTPSDLELPTAPNILIAGRNFTGQILLIDEFRMLQQALEPEEFLTSADLLPDFQAETDFSTDANPNGAWSYRDGDGNLISNVVSSWQSAELGADQEAFSESDSSLSGWAAATGGSALDLPQGSLFTRGPAQLWWIAQEAGNVSLSGGVWIAGDAGVAGQVSLRLNDIPLAFTNLDVTAASSSGNVVGWGEGDGGSEVTIFGVREGDVLKVSTDIADYVGMSIVIFSTPTATPKPPPIVDPVSRSYDIAGDFSDLNNPNGAWSYRDAAGNLIPASVAGWLPDQLGLEQPAWADSEQFAPGWALSNGGSLVGPHPEYDWPVDTVMSHGPSLVRWKAPGDGNVTISGGAWLLRSFGLDQSVRITYNGSIFASGTLVAGDAGPGGAVNSTKPLSFESFGQVPGSLSFGVRFRDEIDFTALPLGGPHDFVAYDVQIQFEPGEPVSDGPVILTNLPQPALSVDAVLLDGEGSAEVYTLAVGDFNGDTQVETAWASKRGGDMDPNRVRVVYVSDTPEGLGVSFIEDVTAYETNQGAWLVRAGDFLGLGRDQLLVAGNWQFIGDDLRFELFDRTTDPVGTPDSWTLVASMQTNLASTGYSAVADLFGNNTDALVLGTSNGVFSPRVLCFDVDVPVFTEVEDTGDGNDVRGTFVGDISGDGVQDIGYFFALGQTAEIGFKSLAADSECQDASFSDIGFLYGNTASTAPFDGSSTEIFDNDVGMGLRLPPARGEGGSIVVGDPSRDGRNEAIVPLGGVLDGYLVSWQANADTHGGLPVDVVPEFEVIDIRRGVTFTAVALGDVNADGLLDIVAGTSDAEIFLYTRTSMGYSPGSTLPASLPNEDGSEGEPTANAYQRCNLSSFDNANLGAITGLEIVDIDSDDKLEIVFTTDFGVTHGRAPGPGGLHVIDDLEGLCPMTLSTEVLFRRGDCDQSGKADFNDAIFHLKFLFLGEHEDLVNSCRDSCDSDDSGSDDFTDDIHLLRFLFLGQGTIPSPGILPDESHPCGPDLTAEDEVSCEVYTPEFPCP